MAKSSKRTAPKRSLVAVPQGNIKGPKKKRSKAPKPRATTHKARSAWFSSRVTWPHREASIRTLVQERTRAAATLPPHAGAAQWSWSVRRMSEGG